VLVLASHEGAESELGAVFIGGRGAGAGAAATPRDDGATGRSAEQTADG